MGCNHDHFGMDCLEYSSYLAITETADFSSGAPLFGHRTTGVNLSFDDPGAPLALLGWCLTIFGVAMLPLSLVLLMVL